MLSRILGAIGRTLITAGTLILLFVAYQLWGTGLQTQQSQRELGNEFEQLLDGAATSTTTSTSAPTTTTTDPFAPPTTVATDGSVRGPFCGFGWLAETGQYGLAGYRWSAKKMSAGKGVCRAVGVVRGQGGQFKV